ncbi:MAG: DUF1848 domain-containing protein [Vicinamibacteria bacterium]|nr:DUF1848 domain-containing protein [Vicinamibacteria bacterium]
MIISASRRTDIPALYAEWFLKRIRAGFCEVANPFDSRRVTRVDLAPEKVEAIVFWTRHAVPLMPYLKELDERGYRYYFLYTILDNPRRLEPRTPVVNVAIEAFRELAACVGPERVVWRYDPILLSPSTNVPFHVERFERIARSLNGRTRRCVVSFFNDYRKTERRMRELPADLQPWGRPNEESLRALIPEMTAIAASHGIMIQSCAESVDLRPLGVSPGKCVDDDLIRGVFGVEVTNRKDPGQRRDCRCVVSRDIGAYDTCVMGCLYCYATSRFDLARRRHAAHDPNAVALAGDGLVTPAS